MKHRTSLRNVANSPYQGQCTVNKLNKILDVKIENKNNVKTSKNFDTSLGQMAFIIFFSSPCLVLTLLLHKYLAYLL